MNRVWTVRRKLLCAFAFLLVLFSATLLLLLRPGPAANFSDDLSAEEQRHISNIVHRHAVRTIVKTFTPGDFSYACRRLRDLPKAVIYAQGNQSDGKIWIHVGIPDATQSDGYRLFSRHFLAKQEGR